MQGFLIQGNDELTTLRNLCDQVYIDTSKSLVSLKADRDKLTKKRSLDEKKEFGSAVDRQLAKTGIKQVLPIYSDTAKTLRRCFKACSNEQYLNAPQISHQVNGILSAVLQNTTAMVWLSRVKSHHNYLSEHSMHVSLLAMVFAVHCGWSKEESRNAGLAGLLFDIGKTRIPRQILTKPIELSDSEQTLIHDHTKWGRFFLEKSGFNKNVVDAAYYHHERPDGNGYPAKRVGSQTPILARLIAILDAYDAMISYRPHTQQRTVFEATRILYRNRGTQFDSDLVDQFIAMIGVYPVGTIVELNSGEVGVIIGQNNNARLLPKISIIRDKHKQPVDEVTANLRDIRDENGKPRVKIKTMLHDGSYGVFIQNYTRQLLTS